MKTGHYLFWCAFITLEIARWKLCSPTLSPNYGLNNYDQKQDPSNVSAENSISTQTKLCSDLCQTIAEITHGCNTFAGGNTRKQTDVSKQLSFENILGKRWITLCLGEGQNLVLWDNWGSDAHEFCHAYFSVLSIQGFFGKSISYRPLTDGKQNHETVILALLYFIWWKHFCSYNKNICFWYMLSPLNGKENISRGINS